MAVSVAHYSLVLYLLKASFVCFILITLSFTTVTGPFQGSLYFQQHNPVTTAMRDVSGSSPGPIGRGRTSSLTNSLALIDPCHMYQKAPGSEREDGAVSGQCSVNCAHLYYNSPYVCMSVNVHKRQVAILARSSREMSQTVRIDWRYILSRVRVSVRPSNFFICKNTQNLGETGSSTPLFIWMKQRPAIDRQRNQRKGA